MECIAPRQRKERWLHEGYRYRRDKINRDGSMSLRCENFGCVGRIKMLADGTTESFTPHSHASCIVVKQEGNEMQLHEGYGCLNDNVTPESRAQYIMDYRQGKERWLYEVYRYRRDRINRDGSLSLRCLHTGCIGRIKMLEDGTTNKVTPHSHAPPTDVSQKGDEMWSHEGYDYQNDKLNAEVSDLLEGINVTGLTPCPLDSRQGKERWSHEGYRYALCTVVKQEGNEIQLHEGCRNDTINPEVLKMLQDVDVNPHSCASFSDVLQDESDRMHEGCSYQNDNLNPEVSGFVQDANVASENITPHCHAPSADISEQNRHVSKLLQSADVTRRGNEVWLHEGYHYRRDRISRDGSMSLRCLHKSCNGRMKKLVNRTTENVTPHNHAPCTTVPQYRKERWLHKGYYYRRDKINRDGSTSLRCAHFGCVGRIKKFVDGTTDVVTPHACGGIKNGAEQIKVGKCNNAVRNKQNRRQMLLQNVTGVSVEAALFPLCATSHRANGRRRKRCSQSRTTSPEIHTLANFEMSEQQCAQQPDCEHSSLSYSPWQHIAIASRKWIVKSVFSDSHYEILFSDLTNVWHEHLQSCDVERRSKEINPSLEIDLSKLLTHIHHCTTAGNSDSSYDLLSSDLQLSLTVTSKLAGLPFCWRFCAIPVSLDMIRHHLTEPLVAMVSELSRQKNELFSLLKSKDVEIADLKAHGACVSRKKLETVVFDETTFNQNALQSENLHSCAQDAISSAFSSTDTQKLYSELMKASEFCAAQNSVADSAQDTGTDDSPAVISSVSKSPQKPDSDQAKEIELQRRLALEKRLAEEEKKESLKKRKKIKF